MFVYSIWHLNFLNIFSITKYKSFCVDNNSLSYFVCRLNLRRNIRYSKWIQMLWLEFKRPVFIVILKFQCYVDCFQVLHNYLLFSIPLLFRKHDVICSLFLHRKKLPDLPDYYFSMYFSPKSRALYIFTCKTNMTQSSYWAKYTHLKCKSNSLTRHAFKKPYKLNITVKQSIFRRDLFA